MTVDEAVPYFSAQTRIHDRLKILQQVGLGYIALGQQATTLSGGEAQRIKLSKELARRATGRTLYILDEPTTGLHFEDVRKLLEVLHALVDQGNTVIVIEHNLEVIKTADWILDLGPEGGDGGGRIVAAGHAGGHRGKSGKPHRTFPGAAAARGGGTEADAPAGVPARRGARAVRHERRYLWRVVTPPRRFRRFYVQSGRDSMWAAPGDGCGMKTLWTDKPDATAHVEELFKTHMVNAAERDDLLFFIEHGWLVWRAGIEPELIDAFVNDIRTIITAGPVVKTNHRANWQAAAVRLNAGPV